MRSLLLLPFLLAASVATAEAPQYDRALALAAGRAYVESFLRLHPQTHSPGSDWSKATIESVAFERQSVGGYVALFVPDNTGEGGGFAYFEALKGRPGHLFVIQWGYADLMSQERARFHDLAKAGTLPTFEYQDH